MAESTLSLGYPDLQAIIGRFLALGDPATYGDATAYGTKAYICEQYIKAGVRKLLFPPPSEPGKPPHSWNFLKPTLPFTLQAPFGTDTTIALTNGDATCTITGGTLPTWIASGVLNYLGRAYGIASRTDATHFELDADFDGTTVTGATYSIDQRDYDLPDSFGYIIGDFTFEPNVTWGGPIPIVGEGRIRSERQAHSQFSGRPTMAAIRPKLDTVSTTVGPRWEAMFFPSPDASYVLSYKFAAMPDKISAADIYTYGGMAHAETLKEACLAAAEEGENDILGLHGQAFLRQLAASIGVDMRTGPQILGYNADRSDQRVGAARAERFGISYYIDANGTRYPS